jgi:hypothetical protein
VRRAASVGESRAAVLSQPGSASGASSVDGSERRRSSSASDDEVGGFHAQDRAPLSWTNERADTLFVCTGVRTAAAQSAILASGASNQTVREQRPKNLADPLIEVAPTPRLTRLEASCDRMAGQHEVPLRMAPN